MGQSAHMDVCGRSMLCTKQSHTANEGVQPVESEGDRISLDDLRIRHRAPLATGPRPSLPQFISDNLVGIEL